MRPTPCLATALLLACAATGALAQPAPAAPPQAVEQKAERIQHKDAGSQIDELRVGGETRRIEVTTQTQVPGYQVAPSNANEAPASGGQRTGNAGKTSWRMLNF